MSYRSREPSRRSSHRNASSSLFVRNVSYDSKPEDIRKLFSRYGYVRDVYIPLDYYTREPRGFAYVEFEDARDATDAMEELDGHRLHERELEIVFAEGDRKNPNMMRRKDAGAERYGYGRRSRSRSRSRSPRRRRRDSRSPPRRSSRRSSERQYKSRSKSPMKQSKSRSKSRGPSASRSRSPEQRQRSAEPRQRSPEQRQRSAEPRQRSPEPRHKKSVSKSLSRSRSKSVSRVSRSKSRN